MCPKWLPQFPPNKKKKTTKRTGKHGLICSPPVIELSTLYWLSIQVVYTLSETCSVNGIKTLAYPARSSSLGSMVRAVWNLQSKTILLPFSTYMKYIRNLRSLAGRGISSLESYHAVDARTWKSEASLKLSEAATSWQTFNPTLLLVGVQLFELQQQIDIWPPKLSWALKTFETCRLPVVNADFFRLLLACFAYGSGQKNTLINSPAG